MTLRPSYEIDSVNEEEAQKPYAEVQAANTQAVKDAISANISLLQKHGLIPKKTLGRGRNGIAFSLDDNRVIKLTTDQDEAKASSKIQGKKSKNVVKIISTFKFPSSNVYGIVQEKLFPLSQNEKNMLSTALRIVDYFVKQMKEKGTGGYREVYGSGWQHFSKIMLMQGDTNFTKDDVKKSLKVLSAFKIPQMMDELLSRGIMFFDYHTGNIMKNAGGDYVVTDLGVSTVHNALEPTQIESIKKEDANNSETAFESELHKNKTLLIKNNIRPAKFIAAGTRGETYLCADGKVLKITMDRSEAAASLKVQGKDLPGVVKVYKVFCFPGDLGFYGILQERLFPLSSADENRLSWANKVIGNVLSNNGGIAVYRHGWQEMVKKIGQSLVKLGVKKGDQLYNNVTLCLRTYSELGIKQMMESLVGIGVAFHDYHPGNVMRRTDGSFVITDLGASIVNGENDIPVLEKNINERTSDTVSIVRCNVLPLNKVQSGFIRNLAKSGKVIIVDDSADLDSLKELITASLPDLEDSIEIYGGKGLSSGGLSRIFKDSPALKKGIAVNLYSTNSEQDYKELVSIGSPVLKKEIPQGIFNAKIPVNRAAAKNELDPHVFSDKAREIKVFKALGIESLSKTIESVIIEHYLKDIGGVEGTKKILSYNLPSIMKRLNKKNLNPHFIGSGTKGAVFDIGDNRVIKISSDVKDVSSAAKLKGKHLKHVTTIYDAFKLHKVPEVNYDVYGIVAEKIEILSEEESDRFNEAFSYVRDARDQDKLFSLLAANKLEEFFDVLRKDIASEEMENAAGSSLSKREKIIAGIPKLVEDRVRMIWDRMREFNIPEMIEELSSEGVLYADYKGDNIGKRASGSGYVLLDIGGKSQGAPPEELEMNDEPVKQESVFSAGGDMHRVSPTSSFQSSYWSNGIRPGITNTEESDFDS